MTNVRTPISLNWLLKRRSRIDGERKRILADDQQLIERSREIQCTAQLAVDTLAERREALKQLIAYYDRAMKSLDDVLGQHEVQIDVELIKAVKEHTSVSALSHGEMSRLIFKCLQQSKAKAVSTTAIALFCWEKAKSPRVANFEGFRFRLRKRLAVLAWEGRLINTNNDRGVEGRWLLSSQVVDNIRPAELNSIDR